MSRRGIIGVLATLTIMVTAAVGTAMPASAGPDSNPESAPVTVTGEMDYDDLTPLSVGDYDLEYSVTVSDPTPEAGEPITVDIAWDEDEFNPFGYDAVAICWDTPPGWAGTGGAPHAPDGLATTSEGVPASGQAGGGKNLAPPVATAEFADSDATNERVEITSYDDGSGLVHRICARADSIDGWIVLGLLDTPDDISGSMSITLEAPAGDVAPIGGLLPTSAYSGDAAFHGGTPLQLPGTFDGHGHGLPADGTWTPLSQPRSAGTVSQTVLGSQGVMRWTYDDDGGGGGSEPSADIGIEPSGNSVTYSLHRQADDGTAVVQTDGSWTYTPDDEFVGIDTFDILIDDGTATSILTITVAVDGDGGGGGGDDQVWIEVDAPDTAVGGESVSVDVALFNGGDAPLGAASLDVDGTSGCEEDDLGVVAVNELVQIACDVDVDGALLPFAKTGFVDVMAHVDATGMATVSSEIHRIDVALPATAWTDVLAWYSSAADWMDYWDLADGYDDGTFRGSFDITRAALARMVYRLAGEPDVSGLDQNPFPDMTDWAADAIRWVAADPDGAGPREPLMTGIQGEFLPLDPITRGQVVRLFYRFGGESDVSGLAPTPFPDTPPWLAEAARWVGADLDGGGPLEPIATGVDGRLDPADPITRAQTSRMLYRLCLWLETLPV